MRHAYTDGSVYKGQGGASVYFPSGNVTHQVRLATNDIIIAELRAVLLAVQHSNPGTSLHVHSDSLGIGNLLSRTRPHPRPDIQVLTEQIRAAVQERQLTFRISHQTRSNRLLQHAHVGANDARKRKRAAGVPPVSLDLHLSASRMEVEVRARRAGQLRTWTETLDHDLGVDLPLQALSLALQAVPDGSAVDVTLPSPLTRAYLTLGKAPGSAEVRRQVQAVLRLLRQRNLKLTWND